MEGVAARVPKQARGADRTAAAAAKGGRRGVGSVGQGQSPRTATNVPRVRPEQEPIQLVLALEATDVTLTEPVGLAGAGSIVHAVPVVVATARRLGLDGWPERAFCEAKVRPSIVRGGTENPEDISCQRCLRALRHAGLLR